MLPTFFYSGVTSAISIGMAVENRLNQRLERSFGRNNDYDCVKVLALYWEDADQDFAQEAYKITEFFENFATRFRLLRFRLSIAR